MKGIYYVRKKKFETSDSDLSAFLLTLGHRLINTYKRDDGYLIFEFENTQQVQQASQDFLNNSVLVRPRSLLENLRRIRIIYHQFKARKGGDLQ